MSSDVKPQINLSIDGVAVSVPPGSTIIKAAEKAGKSVPHFCYHPGLSVAGQCRMCFVEVEGVLKLQTACSAPVSEGMKVLTQSQKVKDGQNATLEFTLLNHPLDCPICDRGGECKLQDYTYDYGPPLSRMVDDKRLKLKHHPVSEQVVLDQERCILCTRCVRFSSEVDGRTELVVNARGSENVIDVFNDQPMLSKFSGNVIDLCPVGALTAKDYRFVARPWELNTHDAICGGCSFGCNIEVHTLHRNLGIPRPDGSLAVPHIKRLVPRENLQVNTWWMCDKGRWGYHYHNEDSKRLNTPLLKKGNTEQFEVSLKEIQAFLDLETTSEWEFWIADTQALEGISWAKALAKSWTERGRKVKPSLNPSKLSERFLEWSRARFNKTSYNGEFDWTPIKKIYASLDYRELETVVPVLSLKLGQALRQGRIEWHKVSTADLIKVAPSADTVALVCVPKSADEYEKFFKLSPDLNTLVLWTQSNSRGLVNEGLCPLEFLEGSLANQTPSGPVFYFGQTTQNDLNQNLVAYLAKAPKLIVADSFSSVLSQKADAVLPITPFYESEATLVNIENVRQFSKGIKLGHPNMPSLSRGAELVPASLKTAIV